MTTNLSTLLSAAQAGYTGSQGYTGSAGFGQMYGTTPLKAMMYNGKIIEENITVPAAHNAGSFGPVEIAEGYTVELEAGATWTIV
jgi:hypothetical protein